MSPDVFYFLLFIYLVSLASALECYTCDSMSPMIADGLVGPKIFANRAKARESDCDFSDTNGTVFKCPNSDTCCAIITYTIT